MMSIKFFVAVLVVFSVEATLNQDDQQEDALTQNDRESETVLFDNPSVSNNNSLDEIQTANLEIFNVYITEDDTTTQTSTEITDVSEDTTSTTEYVEPSTTTEEGELDLACEKSLLKFFDKSQGNIEFNQSNQQNMSIVRNLYQSRNELSDLPF